MVAAAAAFGAAVQAHISTLSTAQLSIIVLHLSNIKLKSKTPSLEIVVEYGACPSDAGQIPRLSAFSEICYHPSLCTVHSSNLLIPPTSKQHCSL